MFAPSKSGMTCHHTNCFNLLCSNPVFLSFFFVFFFPYLLSRMQLNHADYIVLMLIKLLTSGVVEFIARYMNLLKRVFIMKSVWATQ